MDPSKLRARYRRIVFFFGRVTLGFIFWEIFLPRIGLRAWSRSTRSGFVAVRCLPKCLEGYMETKISI